MGHFLDKIRILLIVMFGLLCGLMPGAYTTVCDAADCGQTAVAAVCCAGEHAHEAQDWQRGHHHHTVLREEMQRAPLNANPLPPVRAEHHACPGCLRCARCVHMLRLFPEGSPCPKDAPPGYRMPLLI